MERLLRVDAFEIVGRIKQVLAAGLALPARQSAKTCLLYTSDAADE